jgi:hypothetical protein
MKKRIEFVQQELIKRKLYDGIIDGELNQKTIEALEKALPLYSKIRPEWTPLRKAYGFLQVACLDGGFNPGEIDGKWGPNTELAFNNYQYFLANQKPPDPWRPEDIVQVNPNNWPVQYTPEFDAFYGPKGSSLVRVQLPYSMKLAWDTSVTVNSFSCHAKVRDSLERVLTNVLSHYGIAEIRRLRLDLFGGCYNERPIRGGTKWSMHSWAIAVDFDPARNKLEWGRDKAAFAAPEYYKWWEFWEEEGWVSLGRMRNFDWMHVQAAKLW